MGLLPHQLYWYARAKDLDKVQDYHLFDCIECGCCDYVCPSQLPLVQYYRFAKSTIWRQEREKRISDKSRERHEYHNFRLEREKEEKEARHRQKRDALQAGGAQYHPWPSDRPGERAFRLVTAFDTDPADVDKFLSIAKQA